MKKIALFLLVFTTFAVRGQISDALTQDTIDLWIVPNNAKSITAAKVNTILSHLNLNKLHKDSLGVITTSGDTIFVLNDTIVVTATNYWTPDGNNIINNNTGDVTIDSALLAPRLRTTARVARVLGWEHTDGNIFSIPISQLADTLAYSGGGIWFRDSSQSFVYLIDTGDFVGIGTTIPAYNLDVKGTLGVEHYMSVNAVGGEQKFYMDADAGMGGVTNLISLLDSNYFSGAVVMDSTIFMVDLDSTLTSFIMYYDTMTEQLSYGAFSECQWLRNDETIPGSEYIYLKYQGDNVKIDTGEVMIIGTYNGAQFGSLYWDFDSAAVYISSNARLIQDVFESNIFRVQGADQMIIRADTVEVYNGLKLSGIAAATQDSVLGISNGIVYRQPASEVDSAMLADTAAAIRGDFPAGGGGGITDISYADIVTAITGGTLDAGTYYRITDFQTLHWFIDGTTTITTGADSINYGNLEPLIVFATSDTSIDSRVYSEMYQQDEIFYDWDSLNWLNDISFSSDAATIVPGWKGVITSRWDTRQDNKTGYDFRNVKFRRWEVDAADWDSDSVYQVDEWCKYSGVIYKSLIADSANKTPSDSVTYWRYMIDVSADSLWSWNSNDCNGIPVDEDDYDDFYTFGTTYNSNTFTGNHIGSNSCSESGVNSYLSILNNIVFCEVSTEGGTIGAYNNTFEPGCFQLTFGASMTGNVIGASMTGNTIGADMYGNTIGADMQSNIIGASITGNVIGADMQSNTIGANMYGNTIGASMTGNVIGASMTGNTIGAGMQSNVIGVNFTMNQVDDNTCNTIDFTLATHVYAAYNCHITLNSDSEAILIYYDGDNVQTIVNAND